MKTILALCATLWTLPALALTFPDCHTKPSPTGCCCATNTYVVNGLYYRIIGCACPIFYFDRNWCFGTNQFNNFTPVLAAPVPAWTNITIMGGKFVDMAGWVDPDGYLVTLMFSTTITNDTVLTCTNLTDPWLPIVYAETNWVSVDTNHLVLCREDSTFGGPTAGYICEPKNLFKIKYDLHGTPFETNWFRLSVNTGGGVITGPILTEHVGSRIGQLPLPVYAGEPARFFRFRE